MCEICDGTYLRIGFDDGHQRGWKEPKYQQLRVHELEESGSHGSLDVEVERNDRVYKNSIHWGFC